MELEIVERLCARFPNHPAMKLGPGDDAAILELAGSSPNIVLSTDLLTEGVDFLLERMNPRKIGRKALAVNLSDLAAMAAEPIACVISVALPGNAIFPTLEDVRRVDAETPTDSDWIFLHREGTPTGRSVAELMERLCDGFLDAVSEAAVTVGSETAKRLECSIPIAIAGGDTNTWNGPLVLSVTVLGRVQGKPLCRNGARAGDGIFVTGPLGGSILRHQFEFKPRIQEMLALNQGFELHAGMDISDGLSLDLTRLCHQSHCGAELFLDQIPISTDASVLAGLECQKSSIYDWIPQKTASETPLEHALGDGEDFEILFTAPWESRFQLVENRFRIPVFLIGRIQETPGLFGRTGEKNLVPLESRGFLH